MRRAAGIFGKIATILSPDRSVVADIQGMLRDRQSGKTMVLKRIKF
jgi:hypothetical protein